MMKRNAADIREALEQVSTQRLDEILQEELQKDQVDEKLVRLILSVLEDRESDSPLEITPEVETAWVRYLTHTTVPVEKSAKKPNWFLRVASVAAVLLVILIAIPQEAEATGFFERIAQWTESIFEFFMPGSARVESVEYVFETDNPGLQEVYDTLVELGITESVVPMWLPEGYELVECVKTDNPAKIGVRAVFKYSSKECVFSFNINNGIAVHQYEKDSTDIVEYELEEAKYYIMKNKANYLVAWERANAECSISIDCTTEEIYKIIDSIY